MHILILGASYGSLLSTKLAMAGHDATLVCRRATADLINRDGTVVRMTLRGEAAPRLLASGDFPGTVRAVTPDQVDPDDHDLVCLAMQEPQYGADEVRALMRRVADSGKPVMSIMNMPPLPYLARIGGLDVGDLRDCYTDASVWDGFDPAAMTLCSPDPQAFRPPEEPANLLHVGLPTNFKAAAFERDAETELLRRLEQDIAAVTLDGKDVPVKLRVHKSIFVPLAKWSMLLTGNYRCVMADGARPIREAVHGDIEASRAIYDWVDALARDLGADAGDQVPFEKYARAAQNLVKPSSAARSIEAGARDIERVDKLVQRIAAGRDLHLMAVDDTVDVVDARLARNRAQ